MHGHESEYEAERRAKAQKMRDFGVDPFGQRADGIQPLALAKSQYRPEMGHDGGPVVKVAGRIMLKRDMGKLSFLTIRDETGDLQVALDKKRLDDRAWEIRGLLDLGDHIVVEGPLGQTNKGETTVWATSLQPAGKALHPPPAKWEGLADVELRYRQRYVDLFANPEVMRLMKTRMQIVEEIRNYMQSRGFLEVETPMLQVLHGGAAARPFVTHSNALDIPLYLRIAPELYLKRLLVGGFRKVFELNRNFRNEGISPRHNPEFTMLEAYEAFGNYETMMELVEGLICHVAEKVTGSLRIQHPSGREITLQRPWRRVSMLDLVQSILGWDFDRGQQWNSLTDETRNRILSEYARRQIAVAGVQFPGESTVPPYFTPSTRQWSAFLQRLSSAELLVEVFEKLIEPTLIDPVFVTRVPSVIIPLARECPEDSYFCDVFELIANGVEIGPGYTELNDPDKQRDHFAHQVGDREEQQKTDEDFLTALKYGMPPAGGMGMGVDRLVSLITGAQSLRDVILFPLMRPQEHK